MANAKRVRAGKKATREAKKKYGKDFFRECGKRGGNPMLVGRRPLPGFD